MTTRAMKRSAINPPSGLRLARRLRFPRKFGIIDRLYGKRLARHGVCYVELSGGLFWKLDLRSVSHRFCLYGSNFSPMFSHWLRKLLVDGGTIIDSGANIGQTVAEFVVSPGVRVFAFEPVAECQEWIAECLSLNGLERVEIVSCGLSNEDGTVNMQVAGGEEIHAAHSTMRLDWYQTHEYPVVEIEVRRLDRFAEEHGIQSIRFWKLDVEGAEWLAVQGAEGLLRSGTIDALYCEISTDNRERLPAYLSHFGYFPYEVVSGTRIRRVIDMGSTARDVLFLSQSCVGEFRAA